MFFFISFLRPPPYQVSPGQSISITPQIANDLRTELFSQSQDVYYSWQPVPTAGTPQGHPLTAPRPVKLTTWREGTAYREVSVPPPSGVREGAKYCLILTAHNQGYPYIVNLASAATGERPLPVLSMPILFSSRRAASDHSKQEQVQRIYRVLTPAQEQIFLTVKEQTSFDLDKKVWDSGIGLSSWLCTLCHEGSSSIATPLVADLKATLLAPDCKILELGAGTGIVSLTIGALRSSKQGSEPHGLIHTTDLPSAMPLLTANIAANKTSLRSQSTVPEPLVLDWDEELPAVISGIHAGYDLIVMADVTYNTASFPSLIRTLNRVVQLSDPCSDQKPPLVVLAYKERDTAERSLWDLAREIGIAFDRVGERSGAGGNPVEIWLARKERQ